jgi:hypothetical protein
MRGYAELAMPDAQLAADLAREARRAAVQLVRWGQLLGKSLTEVARDIGVLPATLRQWMRRWKLDRLEAKLVGRPPSRELDRERRQSVLAALHVTDGWISAKTMMQLVEPPAARSAVQDIKDRWHRAVYRRGGRLCARLSWPRVGSVWALDWTMPDAPVEGVYRRILVVRDLASGVNLLSLPCERESGKVAARELELLIRRHGAPAVVKSDNGSSLVCDEVRIVLAYWGILALVSPPACPGYNGACEAGINSLKVRAHHVASAAGRAEEWSCDDVEWARRSLNTRPRRSGFSAEDSWKIRRPFGERERERLWQLYRREQERERVARGIELGRELTRMEQASVDRAAIARALEEDGLVRYRRRWIRPPIRGRKASWKR